MKYVFFSIIDSYALLVPLLMYKNIYYFFDFIILFLSYLAIKEYKEYDKNFITIIIINILLEVLFNYSLIIFNHYLLFASKLLQFIFSIHLNELIYQNKKSAKLIVPYILWNFILTLFTTLILFIYCS